MNKKETALYEKAFKLFYDKNYPKATVEFNKLIALDGTPDWVKVKIRQFQNIVDARTAAPTEPDVHSLKTVSYHMNLGEFQTASDQLDGLDLPDGTRFFLRAEMSLEQEDIESAVDYLKQAIEAEAANTGYALNSPVFGPYLKEEAFEFLREITESNTQ